MARSGKSIARRSTALMIPAQVGSNLIGGCVVLVLIAWALPLPEHLPHKNALFLWNGVGAAIYGLFGAVVGTLWGLKIFRGTREWLVEERRPTEREQKRALRLPLRQLRVNMILWLIAAASFSLVNAFFSGALALTIGITILLGGITTCASAYLLAERIQRPVFARALDAGVPDKPLLPGLTLRSMVAWALGSGVPLLGLFVVALLALTRRDISANQLAITALSLSSVAIIVGLFITWQTAHHSAAPLRSVRKALRRIEKGDLDAEVEVFDGSELGLLQAGFNTMGAGLREREEIRDLFGRHVGEDVARAAMERGIEMGGEEREVAVLFIDITGSTALAAERAPTEVVKLLNDFFRVVIDVVEEHDGLINKFEGDAALAIFGAPIERDGAAACALAAARTLCLRLRDEVGELDFGIGVSAGIAVAGNIGAESRFEYTVIGDPVNEAARLCELAKDDDTRVLASASALEAAGDGEAGSWETGEPVELRGRAEETRTARPLAR
jgi:adenylate cyclase